MKRTGTADRVRRDVAARTLRPQRYSPPRRLDRSVTFTVEVRCGWTTYEVTPRAGAPTGHRVIYLHGGGYVSQIRPFHWAAVAKIAVAAPARIVVPIYPLAPHATAQTTVATATEIAAALVAETGAENVTLMGDSAGGGMALAIAQQLRDRHQVQPARIVLLSPWLDLTMTHPRISAIDRHDAMLSIAGCTEAGRLYAGDLDPSAPAASPIYGEITGLAPITMFSGTHDILNADAHALVEKAQASGVRIEFHEHARAQHVYQFMPTRDGRAARAAIELLVKGTSGRSSSTRDRPAR